MIPTKTTNTTLNTFHPSVTLIHLDTATTYHAIMPSYWLHNFQLSYFRLSGTRSLKISIILMLEVEQYGVQRSHTKLEKTPRRNCSVTGDCSSTKPSLDW